MQALSTAEARLAALTAQGLGGASPFADVGAVLDGLAAIQIDVIAVLARSHELVCSARLGPVGRTEIDGRIWGRRPATTFEYMAHATCVLPIGLWPYFAFRRRKHERDLAAKPKVDAGTLAEVRAILADGPVTATELGGAGRSGRFSGVSGAKAAAEILYLTGEVVCADRQSFKRVYDLPERVVPTKLRKEKPGDAECVARLVGAAVRALGVATRADIADYFRLGLRDVDAGLASAGAEEVAVEGWDEHAWADPGTLAAGSSPPGAASRPVLLSPFDSLVWDRPRTERLFGFSLTFEAYKRSEERTRGYYTMPLLVGDALAGWVDPAREGRTLVLRAAELSKPATAVDLAAALQAAAEWTGCDDVNPEVPGQPKLTTQLRRALA